MHIRTWPFETNGSRTWANLDFPETIFNTWTLQEILVSQIPCCWPFSFPWELCDDLVLRNWPVSIDFEIPYPSRDFTMRYCCVGWSESSIFCYFDSESKWSPTAQKCDSWWRRDFFLTQFEDGDFNLNWHLDLNATLHDDNIMFMNTRWFSDSFLKCVSDSPVFFLSLHQYPSSKNVRTLEH